MNKKMKILFFCITLFVCVAGCDIFPKGIMAAPVDDDISIEKGEEEKYLIDFLDALKFNDKEMAKEIWPDGDDELRNAKMDTISETWNGRDVVSYTKLGEEFRPKSETMPEGMIYHYQLKRENETIEVEFGMSTAYEQEPKMDSFRFSIDPEPIGSIATWRKYNPAQWFMVLLSVCEILFSLYVAVRCIKERPKLWILWVVFILAAYGGIAFTFTDQIQVGAFAYTFFMPKILIHSSIGVQIFLSVPFGAIIYYWRSKKKGVKKIKSSVIDTAK